jgi:hypothetical protein
MPWGISPRPHNRKTAASIVSERTIVRSACERQKPRSSVTRSVLGLVADSIVVGEAEALVVNEGEGPYSEEGEMNWQAKGVGL